MHPVVSVVTPFYETGPVFHETAEALFAQTLRDFEWIIVNDCSRSPEALAALARYRGHADQRIRVIDLEQNAGPSAARNRGVEAARSPFVFFLDSDDSLEPTCLEKLAWKLATHPELDFVSAHCREFGEKSGVWPGGFHEGSVFLRENRSTIMTMIRREAYLAVGGFDEGRRTGLEDWAFWLKCAANGRWGGTVHEPLVCYRRRKTHTDRWSDFDVAPIERFRASIPELHPGLTENTFPAPRHTWHEPCSPVGTGAPFANPAKSAAPSLLMILPHMEMGGADKWNWDLVSRLVADHGWHVTLVATNATANAWRAKFEEVTKDVFVLDSFLDSRDHPRFLRYLIGSRRPEVVLVSNSHYGYSLAPYLKAHHPDIPFVDYVHMEEDYWRSGGYAMDSLRQSAAFEATGVTSEHLRRWMLARGGDASKIRPVYINVDERHWNRAALDEAALRRKWSVDGAHPVVLYPCRFVDQKQPDVFAKTVDRIFAAGVQATFLIAGDGPMRPVMEALAARHPSGVRLLGKVASAEIRELLALSDVLFIPSKMEGISLAYYEAMAMGVVPVGADVGGQAELVTPACGILLKREGDESARYAESLGALLRDAARLAGMKSACRERIVSHFSLEHMVSGMLELFTLAKGRVGATPAMPVAAADAYATEIVEQFRLMKLCDSLWAEKEGLQPLRRELEEVRQGKDWLEGQWQAWMKTAKAYEARIAQLEADRGLRLPAEPGSPWWRRLFCKTTD